MAEKTYKGVKTTRESEIKLPTISLPQIDLKRAMKKKATKRTSKALKLPKADIDFEKSIKDLEKCKRDIEKKQRGKLEKLEKDLQEKIRDYEKKRREPQFIGFSDRRLPIITTNPEILKAGIRRRRVIDVASFSKDTSSPDAQDEQGASSDYEDEEFAFADEHNAASDFEDQEFTSDFEDQEFTSDFEDQEFAYADEQNAASDFEDVDFAYAGTNDFHEIYTFADEQNAEAILEDQKLAYAGLDVEQLDPFLCSGKIKPIKLLINSGMLPTQRTLDKMCQMFGRKSKVIKITCKAICEHIKSKHAAIAHVWAAYKIQNTQRVNFVIHLKRKPGDEKGSSPIRLDKLVQYSYFKQYVGEFSLEGSEVRKLQASLSKSIDEESYQSIQSCITKHSEDLMKKHKYLSIISTCSHRSKGFGAFWELLPQNCIVCFVQTKDYIPIDEEPFETSYDGIQVDVREGTFTLFGRTAKKMLDPVRMGCQIRGEIRQNQYVEGTLGCFVDHPQFGVCGLTCAHVLLSPWELLRLKTNYSGTLKWPLHDMCKNVYQPADKNSSIGHTVQFIYKEGSSQECGMDLALFRITDRQPKLANFPDTTTISGSSLNSIKYDSWRIYSADRLNKKEKHVIKFGSNTELTRGTIKFDTIAVKELDSYPLASGYAVIKLFKQVEIEPEQPGSLFADIGDSGAPVFVVDNDSQHSCLGIVEGGTTYGTVVVTPIVPILKELEVPCLKSFEAETSLSNMHDKINNLETHVQKLGSDMQTVCNEIQNININMQAVGGAIQGVQTLSNDIDIIKQYLLNPRP